MRTSVKKISRLISSIFLFMLSSSVMAIEVSTCAELDEAINVLLANDIELVNDIECRDYPYTPAVITFSGHFNGHGFAINNLRILSGGSSNAGLFDASYMATIENLTINSPAIDSIRNDFSTVALLGSFVVQSSIQSVSVKNFAVQAPHQASISALANIAFDSEFNNIVIDNFAVASIYNTPLINAGTIAGMAHDSTINNATIEANIMINPDSFAIGGIVGQAENVKITNSNITVYMGSNVRLDPVHFLSVAVIENICLIITNVSKKILLLGN